MDWNDIRLIAEIGRTGSFTAAAAALGVSKPTVSRRVAYLEQVARAQIFRRGPHGAALTAVGETLMRQAAPAESAVLDFERLLRSQSHAARRVVVLRMSEGVASYLITPAAEGLPIGPLGQAAHRTGIKLPSLRLVPPDSAERADIALVWTPSGGSPRVAASDRVRKLADIRFVPLYSGTYGADRKAPDTFRDLTQHRLLTMHAYQWFSNDGWADWHGTLAASRHGSIAVEWSSAMGFLIRGGAGIGLLPTYAPMYSDGVLPLNIKSPPMFGSLWAASPEEAYKEPAVQDCFGKLGKLFKVADWMNEP